MSTIDATCSGIDHSANQMDESNIKSQDDIVGKSVIPLNDSIVNISNNDNNNNQNNNKEDIELESGEPNRKRQRDSCDKDTNNDSSLSSKTSGVSVKRKYTGSEGMCGNDVEAPTSKSQMVSDEAVSTSSAGDARRCRRYKPLFPMHFELDADSATVYIDGSLAARVCSVVKNSIDEIPGIKRVVAPNPPAATTTLPSNKKNTKQGKEWKRTDSTPSSATSSTTKRSKLSTSTETKQDEKRKRTSSIDGSTRSESVASCSSSVDYNNLNLPASTSSSRRLSSSSRPQSCSKSSSVHDVDTIDIKPDVKEVVKELSSTKQETTQNDQQKVVDKQGAKKPFSKKYRSEKMRMKDEEGGGKDVFESDDVLEIRKDGLEHASVAGLNDDEILKMFGIELQLNVVLERLDESSIELLREKIRRETSGRAAFRESVIGKKKRRTSRVRVGSSSSTESERENAPSVMEQLGKKPKEKKRHKPKGTDRTCITCEVSLYDCMDTWLKVLGPRTTYCSLECVEKQVEKAKAVIGDESARVMLLDRSGTMLNGPSAPKLVDLFVFLREHPEFAPVLPSSQVAPKKSQHQTVSKGEAENKSQRNVAANKMEKLISKENDQRRFQVRRAICEKLLVRAKKTADLAFTQQELKALSQRIEEELFRQCRHSVSGKYRSWFKQFMICVTDETNKGFYLRTILGEISVPKLVSLDATELGAEKLAAELEIPAASRRSTATKRTSSPLNDGTSNSCDEKKTNAGGGDKEHSSEAGKDEGNSKETTNTTVPDENDVVDEGEAVNPFPEKIPTEGMKSSKPVKAESEVDKLLGLEPMNTTAQHRFHLFDMNCDICTGKRERELAMRKQKREKRERRASRSGVIVADMTAASPSKTTAVPLLTIAKTPQKLMDKSEATLAKRVDTDEGNNNKSTRIQRLSVSDSWRSSGLEEQKKRPSRPSSTDADDGWMGPDDDYDIVDEIDDTDDFDGTDGGIGSNASVDKGGAGSALTVGKKDSASIGGGFDMDEDDDKPFGWKPPGRDMDPELNMNMSHNRDDSLNGPISDSWRNLNFAKRKEDGEKTRKKDIASGGIGVERGSSLITGLIGESWRHSIGIQQDAESGVSYDSWRRTTIAESHQIVSRDDEKRTTRDIKPLLEPLLNRRSLMDIGDDINNNNNNGYGKGCDKNVDKEQRVSGNGERWKKHKHRLEKLVDKKKSIIEPIDEQFEAPSTWDLEADHAVWHGMITMGQFLQFQTSFTALSNERAFRLREEFPSTLRIIGRIPPQVVVDYLANLKRTRTKDVIILNMDSPVLPEVNAQFLKCFMDMRRKNRYSVLALDEQPTLKDGYLIALASGEQPPAVLLPYDGPGIADNHPDMIICVIVRHRDTAAAAARAQMVHQQQQQQHQQQQQQPAPKSAKVTTGEVSKSDDPLRDIDIKPTIEIPLERRNRSPSPSTIMREFEYSMEERQQRGDSSNSPLPFIGNISPTMVHVRPSTSSFVDAFGTDQEQEHNDHQKVEQFESKNSGQGKSTVPHFFGSPRDNDQLWSGMVGSEDDNELAQKKSSVVEENNPYANSLLPPGFFERIQKSTAVKAPMPSISTISDLLVAIHTHTQPSEIAFLVADFTAKNVLGAEEQKLIENAIKKKVLVERKKRGDVIEELDGNKNARLKKLASSNKTIPLNREVDDNENEEDMFTASDFETGSKPSTFVGDDNAERLKQMNIKMEGGAAHERITPISPDEPAIPLPPVSAVTLDLNTSAPPPPLPPPPPPPIGAAIPLVPPVPPPVIPNNADLAFPIPPPFPPPPMAPASFLAPPNVSTMASNIPSSSAMGVRPAGGVTPSASIPITGTNVRKTRISESNTGGSGEMDMDISDDDEQQEKSESNTLLPPPPPPPAFHVPVPQPPPVPNIPLLPIPSVPTPSPVIGVQRNEKGQYFGMNAPPPPSNIQAAGTIRSSYRQISPKPIPVTTTTSKITQSTPSIPSNVLPPPPFPLMDPSVPPPSVGSSLAMTIINAAGHSSVSGGLSAMPCAPNNNSSSMSQQKHSMSTTPTRLFLHQQTQPQSIAGMSYNPADKIGSRELPEEDDNCHRSWNTAAASLWSLGKGSSKEIGGRDLVIDLNQPSTSANYHPQDPRNTTVTVGVPSDQTPSQPRSLSSFNMEQYFDEADDGLGSSASSYSSSKEKSSLLPTPGQQQPQQPQSSPISLSLYQTAARDRDDRASFSHFQLSADRTCGYSGPQQSPIQQQQQQRSVQQPVQSVTPATTIRMPLLSSSHQYEPIPSSVVDMNRVLYKNEDVRNLSKWSDELNMSSGSHDRPSGSAFMSRVVPHDDERIYKQTTTIPTNRSSSYAPPKQMIYSEQPPPLLSSRHGQASSAAGYASSFLSSPPPTHLSNPPNFEQNIMRPSNCAPISNRSPSPLSGPARRYSASGNAAPLGFRGMLNSGRGEDSAGNGAYTQHRPPPSSLRGGLGSGSRRGTLFDPSRNFYW